jgi:hypothetical protein
MLELEARDIVVDEEGWFTIWRRPGLVVVRLRGEIDDAQSAAWRIGLSREFHLRGTPRFVAFDMYDSDPRGTMTSRVQVVTYVREMMRRVEWAALLVPRRMSASLAVRVVARLIDITNVSIITTRAELSHLLGAMRAGRLPRD